MAEWLFDEAGTPCLILDGNRIRDEGGAVIGWAEAGHAYLLHGQHVGWFEGGVLYDSTNCALAYGRNRTGYLPGGAAARAAPALPAFAAAPPLPALDKAPVRPGRGAWSPHDPGMYFS